MKIEDRWVRLVMNVGDLPDESNARTILIELLSDQDFRDAIYTEERARLNQKLRELGVTGYSVEGL